MTARNNLERLGVDNPDAPIPQTTDGSVQPTLQFVTPTEFVELPSKGKFYPAGHPLHNVDVLEVKYMTAKEEDILTSRTLLKKGIAIDRMLQSVIVRSDVNIDDLLTGDKNALIVAARVTGYGADYAATVACPSCGANHEFVFDLEDTTIVSGEEYEDYGVKTSGGGNFSIVLPKSKAEVEVKPMTSRDEKRLLQMMESKAKKNIPETNLTDQLRLMIVSVNGYTDENYINSFIEAMPALDSRILRNTYQKIIPNIDLTQDYTCPGCGFASEMEVPFGANFFWPR